MFHGAAVLVAAYIVVARSLCLYHYYLVVCLTRVGAWVERIGTSLGQISWSTSLDIQSQGTDMSYS